MSTSPASTHRRVRALHAGLALTLLLSTPVLAQQVTSESASFSLERMRISNNRLGLIDVESAELAQHLKFDVGLWVGFERNPLVVNRLSDGERLGALVSDRFAGSVFGSVGFFNWLELGLELPVVLYQTRPSDLPGVLAPGSSLATLQTTNIGDVRAQVKIRLLRQQDFGVNLAVMPAVTFPSGGAREYFGESRVLFAPEALLSRNFEHLRIGLNVGAVIRPRTVQLDETVESELTGRFGIGYRFYTPDRSRGAPVEIDASLASSVSAYRPFVLRNQSHLEARLMAAVDATDTLQFLFGGGVGLISGWGTPDYRLFLGARFGNVERREHNAPVEAPRERERDDDRDGLVGTDDRCPTQAGPRENSGCPDVDTDADGIVDRLDRCPYQAEDKDNFEDSDGCPDPDNDADGVLDTDDKCPREKGPATNAGCPDPDRDGDTVVDRLDNCPDEPGTVENQGCAEQQLVVLSESGLRILENVYFKTNKDVIEARSFPVLNNVVSVLKAHPDVKHVLVEGHTDSVGSPKKNLDLSDRRAKSVVRYLVSHGVEAERLQARGFGQTKPIESNKTAAGREKNRRVVFTIVSEDGSLEKSEEAGGNK